MHERQCFVISVFGDRDSPRQEDRDTWRIANEIMQQIIHPAMRQVSIRLQAEGQGSIRARRGDSDPKPGKIIKTIYERIRRDQVLIAVLFRPNENVAYEIGLAHAMGRPVILLRFEGYEVKFDLDHDRRIHINKACLDSTSPSNKTAVTELSEHVLELISPDGTPAFISNEFYKYAAPFARCIPLDRMRIPLSEWSDTLLEAEREIWLSGHTLHRLFESTNTSFSTRIENSTYRKPANILEILLAQLVQGCCVNILIMDRDSASLERRVLGLDPKDPDADRKLKRLKSDIQESEELIEEWIKKIPLARSAKDPGTLRFTKVRFGQIANRVLMSERRAYVTPIFHSFAFNTGPSFETYPKSRNETYSDDVSENITLYSAVLDDLKHLQNRNPTLIVHPNGIIDRSIS